MTAEARLGVRLLRPGEPAYPDLLSETPDPPALLYVRGSVPLEGEALAVVGSRRPTHYGRRMARELAGACARAGIPVVSGLARGIDSEAHRAALAAGGRTWAVLGSGLDNIYPPENKGLAEEIVAAGGALLSELPLSGPPLAMNFPRRNRILSGLAWGTVVVEGDLKSGSLITARAAAEQGREVFAVPGPADSPMSEGPHELLRQGARMARRLEDILEELPMLRGQRPPQGVAARLPSAACMYGPATIEQEKILKLLGSQSMTLEEMLQETGWDIPQLVRTLTVMEESGVLKPLPGQSYARA